MYSLLAYHLESIDLLTFTKCYSLKNFKAPSPLPYIRDSILNLLCWLWSLVFDFRRWRMRWWKYFRQSRMKADRFLSEIGISQFLLDLLQFRFPMLWGTEPVPFGTRAIQIWTRSIPVSLPEMRKWNQGRNRRMRWRKPSAITNIFADK